jgi:hypothetical protein
MIKYKDLILSHEIEQTETVFLDEPSDEFSNRLLFELKDVISLRVFAVENLEDYIFLGLSFEELFHLK